MARPYDASEEEATEPDDEIIEAGFDPLVFWDQNKQAILLLLGVLLLAGAGLGWYEISTARRAAAAEAALSAAVGEDDYRKIIDQYPGTVAAGNASLLLADALRTAKKYDDATDVLNEFIAKYPAHPLAPAGMLSLAETMEVQGKADDALNEYQEVSAKYPDSYSAPLALLAEANLLKSQGKLEDARRTYENFLSQFPDSVFTNEATAHLHLLRLPQPAASASPAGPEALPNAPGMLQIPASPLMPAASPAAPVASPAAAGACRVAVRLAGALERFDK